ncbi:sialate O-acetylesterase [Mucilaginibacter sp. SG564]|uniref:sialate O-acetylesterase n=1 Tax=Mucilaginibacter sp. SG564 TaxID=2587022 RepID=UPI0015522C27|nr:sialate O-acetylesterase [Mucilaginibacter sp. SG564]NOW96398.1 sialate O-acetylesterase [Mucilaginibacter sp. SG564]
MAIIKAIRVNLLILSVALICPLLVKAEVRLPQLISSNMILQRNTKLKIWGWATPKEKVAVAFNGKVYKTITQPDSSWMVVLPAMKAGGPYKMTVAGSNKIELTDILLGDVWFCSGQSNMVNPIERVKEKYPDDVESANYPEIRNFFIPTAADVRAIHKDLPPGKWIKTDPKTVMAFGSASYFFARDLYQRYHVPIGIINSSVGGTPIQAWINEDAIKGVGNYALRLAQFRDSAFLKNAMRPRRQTMIETRVKPVDQGMAGEIKWYDTNYQPKHWHKFWLPGYWADQGVKGLNGIVWFRKEISVPPQMVGKPAKLFLGRIIDADETYVNGQQVGNITYQYPPRRYVIPAGVLKPGKNLIVVRVTNTAGKGGFVPDKRYELTDDVHSIDLRGDWEYQVGLVYPPRRGLQESNSFFNAQNEPTGLYNTMVAPAINYGIKGVVWYQGEANVGTANYSNLLSALIKGWRKVWDNEKLPFLVVQLPNYGEVEYSPNNSQWAEIREAQLKALSIPNTGIAVAIDAGEWNDIHPLDKKDVGNRLALAAEKVGYNENDIVYSGPIFDSAQIEGNHIILTFRNTGGGLIAKGDEPLSRFAIAGADKKFVWAIAHIENDKVVVSNPEIDHPLYVRYAWADNPEGANLYNKEGLPASPFRTDQP